MFLKLFKKFKHQAVVVPQQAANDEQLEILKKLQQENCRLMVTVDNKKGLFQSIIISEDRKNNTILMDSLFPKPDFRMGKDSLLNCEFNDNGSTISFSTRLIENMQSDNTSVLLMNYPFDVKNEQRRSNFRISLKPGQVLPAKLNPKYQPILSGIIKDISSHGLRINIQGENNDSLHQGDVLNSCEITLDNNHAIECQLTVRSKQYFNRPYRHTQIGTEITNIQLSDRKRLNSYVNQQQREQCKLRATDRL